jgi:hypothetical protein
MYVRNGTHNVPRGTLLHSKSGSGTKVSPTRSAIEFTSTFVTPRSRSSRTILITSLPRKDVPEAFPAEGKSLPVFMRLRR